MSSAMELNKDTLQQIGEYVKQHLPEWQRESVDAPGVAAVPGLSAEYVHRTIDLSERIVRVEEELKTQRDLIRQGFAEAARRSEEQAAQFNNRFGDVNKRFDDVNKRFDDVNKRFDDVNKRFEEQTATFNKRFEEQTAQFNKRFDDVNKRFEDIQKHTNRWMVLISLFLAMIGAMPWIMGAY